MGSFMGKIYYNFMHHNSQRKIVFTLNGDSNPEEKMPSRQLQPWEKCGRMEESSHSTIIPHHSMGIRMHKSTILCHPDLTRTRRASKITPENGRHSHETSECSYKVKTQAPHWPPPVNKPYEAIIAQRLSQKRNHFLTVVSRLPRKSN